MMPRVAALFLLTVLGACSALVPRDLPDEAPPLVDLEQPLALFAEPGDEDARRALPLGGFTGLVVKTARQTLDPALAEPGLLVTRVVENSPADAAGLREDDILLAVVHTDGREQDLEWPSQWRDIELAAEPGETIEVVFDRAGREGTARVGVVARVRPTEREPVERFEETDRVGVVLRTATEVEARAAGLAPGGGAVVVGLSAESPFRRAGIVYGDILVSADDHPIDHPQVVLTAIREADEKLRLEFFRDGEQRKVTTALSSRERELTHAGVPPLFDYENDRGSKELSILLGLIRHRTTPVAWDWRIFWLIHFSGGEADRLTEVENP